MCIRDRDDPPFDQASRPGSPRPPPLATLALRREDDGWFTPVSYTHLRAHETVLDLVCRLLLEKKKTEKTLTAVNLYKHEVNVSIASNTNRES